MVSHDFNSLRQNIHDRMQDVHDLIKKLVTPHHEGTALNRSLLCVLYDPIKITIPSQVRIIFSGYASCNS